MDHSTYINNMISNYIDDQIEYTRKEERQKYISKIDTIPFILKKCIELDVDPVLVPKTSVEQLDRMLYGLQDRTTTTEMLLNAVSKFSEPELAKLGDVFGFVRNQRYYEHEMDLMRHRFEIEKRDLTVDIKRICSGILADYDEVKVEKNEETEKEIIQWMVERGHRMGRPTRYDTISFIDNYGIKSAWVLKLWRMYTAEEAKRIDDEVVKIFEEQRNKEKEENE